jgi:hypothetical protein
MHSVSFIAGNGAESEAVHNVDVDVDVEARDMEAFWTSLETFLASESSTSSSMAIAGDTASTSTTAAAAADSAGDGADGEDAFTMLWGKSWSAADVKSKVCLVDLLAQADHNGALNLKAEDILQ